MSELVTVRRIAHFPGGANEVVMDSNIPRLVIFPLLLIPRLWRPLLMLKVIIAVQRRGPLAAAFADISSPELHARSHGHKFF